MKNNIIVKDTWIMPKANEETTLTLQEPSDLLVGCWLWNPSVGYLEVTKYSGYDIYVKVKNLKMEENAREGSVFPGCMEMLVIAPNATPILDNNVTCLSADFISPEEGSTALMKVVDSSAIKAADLIIVDNKYQYVVIQVIDEHTLEVLNEGKGAEGIIKIDCTGCVSVKIFESTYCCKVLQEEVDDIYDTLNNRHSIKAWTGNNLVTISGGNDALIASYDVTVKVDNDLSKYDNTIAKYTKLIYFSETNDSSQAEFIPNRNTGLTIYDLGNSSNYYDNAYINNLYDNNKYTQIKLGGDINFYLYSYKKFRIFIRGVETHVDLYPVANNLTLGKPNYVWSNVYTNAITLNGTTYTSIPAPANNGKLTIYNSDGVTPFIEFTADQSGNTSATLPTIPTPATVNDAKLSIYKSSDAVNPVIEFTANAATAVNATLADVAFSGSYSDLGGTPSIPTVNDNTITIQLNGSLAGSFTTNDTSARTINIQAQSALTYFEETGNSTTATWKGKNSGQYYLGTSTSNFTSVRTHKIEASGTDGIVRGYVEVPYNLTSSMVFYVGASSDELGYIFYLGGNNRAKICNRSTLNPEGTSITVDFEFSHSHSSRDSGALGNTSRYWKLAFIDTIYAANVHPRTVSGGTPKGGDLGGTTRWWASAHIYNLTIYNGTVNGVNITSDSKIKTNVNKRDCKGSLDKIKQINTYTFNYKTDTEKDVRLGFLADEIKDIAPLCVKELSKEDSAAYIGVEKSEVKENLFGIDVGPMITLLAEAIKELAQDVADLKKALTKGDDNEYKEVSKEG